MTKIVTRCPHCLTIIPEGHFVCDKCNDQHTVATRETRILLSDITYSRRDVSLSPTDKQLGGRGHIGRRAIACKHMPQELQNQIRNFILTLELAPDPTEKDRTASNTASTTPATPPAPPLAGRQQHRQQKDAL